jgi:hypothetical protein
MDEKQQKSDWQEWPKQEPNPDNDLHNPENDYEHLRREDRYYAPYKLGCG